MGHRKLNKLSVLIPLAMLGLSPMHGFANNSPATSDQSSTNPYFLQKGRQSGIPDMLLPSEIFVNSAGRFGEQRSGHFHTGIDMSSGKSTALRAGDDGKVISKGFHSAAGNLVVIQRDAPNGQTGDHHAFRYLHMKDPSRYASGSKVRRGEVVGTEGATGRGGVHLHLDYLVPKKQAISTALGKTGPSSYKIQGVKGGSAATPNLMYTDPTPYLDRDFIYSGKEDRGSNPMYSPWLGNSWRWQFNTLYGTQLPTLPGSKGPTKKIPETLLTQLNAVYSQGVKMTPEELAAARRSLVEASITASQAGFDLSGQVVSQSVLASMLLVDDGKDFMTLPPTTRDLQLTEQSPKHIISTIGKSRYGNMEWVKGVQTLNSKGMFNEYVQMTAELNFIRERKLELRNRIEYLLASLASVEQYAHMKKIAEIQKAASAATPPSIIDLQLEVSGDEWKDGAVFTSASPEGEVLIGANGDVNPNAHAGVVADNSVPTSSRAAKAASYASKNVLTESYVKGVNGWCARYVRKALQHAGYKFTQRTSAYMYKDEMSKMGFTQISANGYVPKVGDVIVTDRNSKSRHGHIQIYDGKNWVSDYRQKGLVTYGRPWPAGQTIWRDMSTQ